VQRIAAYAVVRDAEGRLLLVCTRDRAEWWLPGGGVEHGEHPEDGVRREVLEETGYAVELRGLREVRSDVVDGGGVAVHSVRLIYDAVVTGGELRHEQAGTTAEAAWTDAAAVPALALAPNLVTAIRAAAGRS
jgi:ADP-ribose pyrophosphatase YjhB (NUDIX family)